MAKSFPVQQDAKQCNRQFRDYTIIRIIHSGQFSEVYEAAHTSTKEKVALKLFKQEHKGPKQYRDVAWEINMLRLVKHEHVVSIQDYQIGNDSSYICTEYVRTGTLRSLIQRAPLPETEVKTIMQQIIAALLFIHNTGIIHGDVKPENVLCSNKGLEETIKVKICDFGISRVRAPGRIIYFTGGSLAYMAPEVLIENHINHTSDLWSAGIILYEMIYGKKPFPIVDNADQRFAYKRIIKNKVKIEMPRNSNYSPDCRDLLKNLLQYSVRVRLQGAVLAAHPFLALPNRYQPVDNHFYHEGVLNLSEAVKAKANSNIAEALILATEAYLKLRIQYNFTDDVQFRKSLEEEYNKAEMLCCDLSVSLVKNAQSLTPTIGDDEFKKHLQSTPQLLNGFEIGCYGEMFLKEGQKKKALELFVEAVDILLPLLKEEPLTERRKILGKRVEQWISCIEQNSF